MLRKYKVVLLDFDKTIGSALLDWLNSLGDIIAISNNNIENNSEMGANYSDSNIIIRYQGEGADSLDLVSEYSDIPQILVGRNLKVSNKDGLEVNLAFINLPLRFVSLEAKIRQLLRFEADKQMKALKIGDYTYSPIKKALVGHANAELKLTEKEISILTYLNQALGASIGREELLREVWRYNEGVTTHTLETHIYRLRQKLAEIFANQEIIMTTDGGYRLQTQPSGLLETFSCFKRL